MKFNSQICTSKSQSERLLALGLKKNTADCYYYAQQRWTGNSYENTGELFLSPLWNIDDKGHFQYLNEVFGDEIGEEDTPYVLPAWSLHRLLEIIPQSIKVDDRYFDLEADAYSIIYHYSFVSEDGEGFEDSVGPTNTPLRDNIYDDIIDNIKWLITGGYFNKEYLEE